MQSGRQPYLQATVTRRLLPVLLLIGTSLVRAASPMPEITATRTDITDAGTVFTGDARLNYEGALLLADRISYDPKSQVAVATGNVSLTRGAQRLLADELTYNLSDRSFSVKDMRIGQDPLYVSGKDVTGSAEKITLRDAVISFSEPSPFTPVLHADNLTYYPGDKLRARSARLGIGSFTPVPVTMLDQSVNDPLLSNARISAGFNSRFGAQLDLGLLAPFTRTVKLGGDLGLYSKRGVLFGPAGEYQVNTAGTVASGSLRSGFIRDNGDRGTDLRGKAVPENRGYVSWDHYQTVGDHVTVFGEVNYWSDSEVMRDFRNKEFSEVQTPDNFLEADYTRDNYVVSAFTRFQPNDYHVVQRRLPEFRFDGLPVDAGAGVYHRVNASIAALQDNSLPAFDDTVNRLDAYYGLTRPFTPREWFSIKPVAGTRFTYYDRALAGRDDYSRGLAEIGFDSDLIASSTHDYKNQRWDIDGLRHLVRPYVSYRAIGKADQGSSYIPPIDRTAFSTSLEPLGLANRRDIDTLSPTNTLRVGMDNALQTRDAAYGSRDLAKLDVASDLRFDRDAGQDVFSNIQSQLTVTPINWFSYDLYGNVDSETFTFNEVNTGVTFKDAGVWSTRFGTNYLKADPAAAFPAGGITGIHAYTFDLTYTLNEVYELMSRLAYDFETERFTQKSFSLRQNIRNLWFITYYVNFRSGDTRVASTTFGVSIELANF